MAPGNGGGDETVLREGNSRWGARHIKLKHKETTTGLIQEALLHPTRVKFDNGETYTFSRAEKWTELVLFGDVAIPVTREAEFRVVVNRHEEDDGDESGIITAYRKVFPPGGRPPEAVTAGQ